MPGLIEIKYNEIEGNAVVMNEENNLVEKLTKIRDAFLKNYVETNPEFKVTKEDLKDLNEEQQKSLKDKAKKDNTKLAYDLFVRLISVGAQNGMSDRPKGVFKEKEKINKEIMKKAVKNAQDLVKPPTGAVKSAQSETINNSNEETKEEESSQSR